MGIGQKLKDTFSSGEGDHSKSAPGAFPSDNDRSYVPPSGTHVGNQSGYSDVDNSRLTNQLENTRLGEIGEHSRDHGGERDVDNRNVMDPADRRHGSNVMSSTGVGGDPTSRSGAIGGEDHHNKLHKREDPRRYEDSSRDTGSYGGSGGLLSSDTPRRNELGSNQQGYDQARYDPAHEQQGGLTSGHHGRHQQEHGVYNTVTGAGSKEDTSRHHGHHKQHDSSNVGRDYGTTTGIGSSDRAYQSEGLGQDRRDYATGSTGHSHDRHSGLTGAGAVTGASDRAYQSEGLGQDRRDYATGSTGHSHDRHSGLTGAVAGTGAAGIAASEAAHHHNQRQGQSGYTQPIGTAHSSYDPASSTNMGQRSYDIQNPNQTGSNTMSSSHQYPAFGRDSAPATGGVSSGLTSSPGHDSIRSEARQPGLATGLGGNHGADNMGTQGSPFGAGKVMHQCQHCGKDNDISRYFGKEAVYRIS